MKRAFDIVVYLLVRTLVCVVQALSLESCQRIARGGGVLFADVLKVRRGVLEENLSSAFPEATPDERRELARRMWEHLLLMLFEIAHVRRKLHVTNWRRYLKLEGMEQAVPALLGPRPAVVVSGHFGNFELGGYLNGLFGFPTFTVARPLDNPYLDRYLNEFRQSTGQQMVPKVGSSAEIAGHLERGATLTLLADQAAGRKGCWVDFFGRPASTHKAIAVFSLANQGPLLVSYARRIGGPLEYEIGLAALADPCDPEFQLDTIPALTQWYTDRLEQLIRRNPEQYWWVHRRWKGTPPARRRTAAAPDRTRAA